MVVLKCIYYQNPQISRKSGNVLMSRLIISHFILLICAFKVHKLELILSNNIVMILKIKLEIFTVKTFTFNLNRDERFNNL